MLGLLSALALTTPALADDGQRKQVVDTQLATLHTRLSVQQQQETALRAQIDGVTMRIRALEQRVGDVSLRIQTLDGDLALHRRRLAKLDALFRVQTRRFVELKKQYRLSVLRLNRRLVEIYESDTPSTIDVILGSTSIQEAFDNADYLNRIGEEDRQVAQAVARSKHAVKEARQHTAALRETIRSEARTIAAREREAEEERNALVGTANSLIATQQHNLIALSKLTSQEQAAAGEIGRASCRERVFRTV